MCARSDELIGCVSQFRRLIFYFMYLFHIGISFVCSCFHFFTIISHKLCDADKHGTSNPERMNEAYPEHMKVLLDRGYTVSDIVSTARVLRDPIARAHYDFNLKIERDVAWRQHRHRSWAKHVKQMAVLAHRKKIGDNYLAFLAQKMLIRRAAGKGKKSWGTVLTRVAVTLWIQDTSLATHAAAKIALSWCRHVGDTVLLKGG